MNIRHPSTRRGWVAAIAVLAALVAVGCSLRSNSIEDRFIKAERPFELEVRLPDSKLVAASSFSIALTLTNLTETEAGGCLTDELSGWQLTGTHANRTFTISTGATCSDSKRFLLPPNHELTWTEQITLPDDAFGDAVFIYKLHISDLTQRAQQPDSYYWTDAVSIQKVRIINESADNG